MFRIDYLYTKPPEWGKVPMLQYKIIPGAGILTPREKPIFEIKKIELEILDETLCKETN
jgi:hypothetical protein